VTRGFTLIALTRAAGAAAPDGYRATDHIRKYYKTTEV